MLYLASRSPRRAELLTQVGIPFVVIDVDVDESWLPDEALEQYAARVATLKAREAARQIKGDHVILAADTAGICRGLRLVKPCDRQSALAMLLQMSGNTHTVTTAIAVYHPTSGRLETRTVSSTVSFRTLSRDECEAYWDTGEPQDKAGGYAIQGLGGIFVERLDGSYSGVMGLPLCETALLLKQFDVRVWQTA